MVIRGHAVLKTSRCFLSAAAAAEPGDQLLLRAGQLGRSESERRCCAAQEVHPGTAVSSAHRRVPQHLQRRQRSARCFTVLIGFYFQLFGSLRCDEHKQT